MEELRQALAHIERVRLEGASAVDLAPHIAHAELERLQTRSAKLIICFSYHKIDREREEDKRQQQGGKKKKGRGP